MYILTELQYKKEAEPILKKIFIDDDPFGKCVNSSIEESLIVFPCRSYIEPHLIEGIIKVAYKLKEKNCYLTNIFRYDDTPNHYYISLSELSEEYLRSSSNISSNEVTLKIDDWIEYVIYSEKGTWGLMISHERHGILAGSSQFINIIRQSVSDLDNQVHLFLDKIESLRFSPNATLEWVPELLYHIYNKEKAQEMLSRIKML
ncbi:hypothetical protein [Cyanothece sp. BG0011]|uniref:hypothetical protein n=1 Tax=Cyanothece sp. BG0011 TaxID=2082950 RepID=UPI000D1DDDFC|nr:hypothetical protein [Cyanothece sp. BG0011]